MNPLALVLLAVGVFVSAEALWHLHHVVVNATHIRWTPRFVVYLVITAIVLSPMAFAVAGLFD